MKTVWLEMAGKRQGRKMIPVWLGFTLIGSMIFFAGCHWHGHTYYHDRYYYYDHHYYPGPYDKHHHHHRYD